MKTQKWWKYDQINTFRNNCNSVLWHSTWDVFQLVNTFLGPLKAKGEVGEFHFDHSVRVSNLAYSMGRFLHLDPKPLLLAGALHDIGKALIPHSTLGKEEHWTEKDAKAMEPHVRRSYELLRDKFNFTAEIVLWHHRFQPHCYPKKMPPPLVDTATGSRVMIPFFGRLLMLADTYDALHRVNPTAKTQEEIRRILIKNNPDLKELITGLYEEKVFSPLGIDTTLEVV